MTSSSTVVVDLPSDVAVGEPPRYEVATLDVNQQLLLRWREGMDTVPMPRYRSTGIIYAKPSSAGNVGFETRFDGKSVGQAQRGGGGGTLWDPPREAGMQSELALTLTEIPVGKQYFHALREAWRRPPPPIIAAALPLPADRDDLSEYSILNAIDNVTSPQLVPPVPLDYMIELLIPQWVDEGLYDVVRRREMQARAAAQRNKN
ncbi:unnamed protein product [Phytomonas sp. EM1]|nr:unnamed protein product [Phytomonas sp. EM1]|eukprot:CCW65090.1 unnamed protein product [Phytomonas sp. isolate EM1]